MDLPGGVRVQAVLPALRSARQHISPGARCLAGRLGSGVPAARPDQHGGATRSRPHSVAEGRCRRLRVPPSLSSWSTALHSAAAHGHAPSRTPHPRPGRAPTDVPVHSVADTGGRPLAVPSGRTVLPHSSGDRSSLCVVTAQWDREGLVWALHAFLCPQKGHRIRCT